MSLTYFPIFTTYFLDQLAEVNIKKYQQIYHGLIDI